MPGGVTYDDILDHEFWFHRIPLGDGRVTPGQVGPEHWDALGLPDDLEGTTVLDVGTFDGLLAFEAERRNADDVLAVDVWNSPDAPEYYADLHPDPTGFSLAKRYLDSDVRSRTLDVRDLSVSRVGTFDLVLCVGVLETSRDPLSIMERLASVADRAIVVEGPITRQFTDPPGAAIVSPDERGPPNGWFKPNLDGFEEMARLAGHNPTDAFHPRYPDAPYPTRNARTRDATTLYRTRARTESVTPLPPETSVTVTYEGSESYRVNTWIDERVQGWLARDAVTFETESSAVERARSLPGTAVEILRRDGPLSLAASTGRFLADFVTEESGGHRLLDRGVVHGTVTDSRTQVGSGLSPPTE